MQGLWDKSSCRGRGGHTISGLYYVHTLWRLLLACLLPLQLYYGHQTVREKLYSSFSLQYLWLTCAQNIVWFSLILQHSVTFCISSARARLVPYEFVLTIKKFGMVYAPETPKARDPIGFSTFYGLQVAAGYCATSISNRNIPWLLRETGLYQLP